MTNFSNFTKRHLIPFLMIVLIFIFTLTHDYTHAYASGLPGTIPVSGSWSSYDILYTLLQSIGISISLGSDSDSVPGAMPAAWDKAAQDAYFDSIDTWQNSVDGSVDVADEKIQAFVAELKALPENIHDGCISISKDLWDFLNTYGYEACNSRTALNKYGNHIDGYSSEYILQYDSWIYTYHDVFSFNTDELAFYYTISGSAITQYVISTQPLHFYAKYDSDKVTLQRDLTPTQYSYYYYQLAITRTSQNAKNIYPLGLPIDSWDSLCSLMAAGEIALNAPDVIWPETDLAYDVVNHVATWDDAIANDLISTAEDDDTVAVIPLVDTGVGEKVYDNVIAGTDEDVNDSEATNDEVVDSSVIATLKDTAAEAGDITKVFPFCIPFDLVHMIKGMQAAKKPPVWHFKFYFKTIDYTFEFTVDMTDYDKYIEIFRAGLIIFYVIILMLITVRYSSGIVKD